MMFLREELSRRGGRTASLVDRWYDIDPEEVALACRILTEEQLHVNSQAASAENNPRAIESVSSHLNSTANLGGGGDGLSRRLAADILVQRGKHFHH